MISIPPEHGGNGTKRARGYENVPVNAPKGSDLASTSCSAVDAGASRRGRTRQAGGSNLPLVQPILPDRARRGAFSTQGEWKERPCPSVCGGFGGACRTGGAACACLSCDCASRCQAWFPARLERLRGSNSRLANTGGTPPGHRRRALNRKGSSPPSRPPLRPTYRADRIDWIEMLFRKAPAEVGRGIAVSPGGAKRSRCKGRHPREFATVRRTGEARGPPVGRREDPASRPSKVCAGHSHGAFRALYRGGQALSGSANTCSDPSLCSLSLADKGRAKR